MFGNCNCCWMYNCGLLSRDVAMLEENNAAKMALFPIF